MAPLADQRRRTGNRIAEQGEAPLLLGLFERRQEVGEELLDTREVDLVEDDKDRRWRNAGVPA